MEKPASSASFDDKASFRRALNIHKYSLIEVGENGFVIGDKDHNLASEGFFSCSAILFRDSKQEIFGLYHAFDKLELHPYHHALLEILAGGQAIIVRSNESEPQDRLMNTLVETYGITLSRTIVLGADAPGNWVREFNVVYLPRLNVVTATHFPARRYASYPAFIPNLDSDNL